MAGSSIVGILKVLLTADTAQYEAGMKRVQGLAKQYHSNLSEIGRQATAVGSSLTKVLTLPILGLGTAAVKAAMDFESSFAGVRKTVNATEPEFAALAQGLRDMAKEIPVNVNELNKVAESAGQLGIKKEDILQFTRTMADLGVTTNLTADEAATATAQIQNIFGTAGKDVDRFGATLVALGNNGASTEKDIIAMGLRIAGAGKQVGLTQAQVLAFASALSSVGINAEAGGSAISRVFLKINDAVAKGGKGLNEFARVADMTGPAFKQAFETDAAGATAAFIKGLARLKGEGENVNATLEGLVGKNIIIKDTLLRAAGAGNLLTDSLKLGDQAWRENTALTKEAAERYKTFASQVTVLWNNVKDVAITLGMSLLPTLKDLVKTMMPVVQMVGEAAKLFAALPEPVRLTVVGFLGLAAAIGPVIWAFGIVATNAGILIKQFTAKGLVMRALTADYAKIVIGARALVATYWPLAAAITAVWAAWKLGNTETVKNTIAEWGLASDNLTAKLYRAVTGIEKMTPEQAKSAVAAIAAAEAAKKQADALGKTAAALNTAGDAATEFVGPIQDVSGKTQEFVEQTKEAKAAAEAFAKSLKSLGGRDAIAGAEEVVKQLHAMDGPLNVLPSKLEEMAARLREGAEAALLMGNVGLANGYTKLADTLTPLIMFQQRYNVTIGEYITDAPRVVSWTDDITEQMYRLSGAVYSIGPAAEQALPPLTGLLNNFTTKLDPLVLTIGDRFRMAWGSMREGLSAALAQIPGTLAKAFEGGGDIFGAVKSIASQIGSVIGSGIGLAFGAGNSKIGQAIGSAIGSLAGPLLQGFKKLFGIGINEEIRKFNRQIAESQEQLIATYGSFERIQRLGKAVGVDLAGAWFSQGEAGKKAFDELAAEFARRVSQMETDLAGFQGDLESLLNDARSTGYIFNQEGEFVSVAFERMQTVAQDYGVDLQALGPAFQNARLAEEAQRIIDAFELLSKGGTDAGTILFGLKDEISKLVNDSIKFGTTIPANMRPWIQNLIDTGQLLDENGEAITDITLIEFGEPVATEFEKIQTAILELIAKIGDLIDRIGSIGEAALGIPQVPAPWAGWGPPPTIPDYSAMAWSGGGGGGGETGFATGTLGRLGKWFGRFPKTGFSTLLHGVEAVITPPQAVPFALDTLGGLSAGAAMGQSAGSGALVVQAILDHEVVGRAFVRLGPSELRRLGLL